VGIHIHILVVTIVIVVSQSIELRLLVAVCESQVTSLQFFLKIIDWQESSSGCNQLAPILYI
jgi:uncharacterized membrane protein